MHLTKLRLGLIIPPVLLLSSIGFAQSQPDANNQVEPSRQTDAANPDQNPRRTRVFSDDPESTKRRLKAAIERGERMLAKQREALERLEAGETPGEVMRSVRAIDYDRQPRDGGREDPAAKGQEAPNRRRPQGENSNPPSRTPQAQTPSNEPATEEEIRKLLKDHLPQMHEQLEKIALVDTNASDRLFERLSPRLANVAVEMRRDQRLGLLRIEELRAGLSVFDASMAFRKLGPNSGGDERESAETSLREAIGARFDAGMALRQYEVEHLVERIGQLNQEILTEIGSRETEIERVFQEIVQRRNNRPIGRDRKRP